MAKQSNIILIFTDNQQASTLGCYGNPEIHTPNLDRLSRQGMTFENAFCPNAFCSPCRASVLTGLMPSQHGVHSWIDDRRMHEWPQGWQSLEGLETLPKLLQQQGYATALIGKYHLGDPTTPMEGFDHWVTLEDGHIRSFYRNKIFENGKSYAQEGHSVDFFTRKAQDFMQEQAAQEQPFFLFLPYPAPYGHWPATKEADTCRHTERYADCPMASIPRHALCAEAVLGYDMRKADSGGGLDYSMTLRAPNDLETLRNYYAQISMVDDGVGAIMETLDQLGIAEDTLLIFTADHGLSVGQHGFWGHGSGTFPSNLHKAAHSVPLIVRQSGQVPRDARSRLMVSNLDLFATLLDYTDIAPPEHTMPSRSLWPLLNGQALTDWGDDVVISEQEETRVIRTRQWALFQRFKNAPSYPIGDELYNVEADPDETRNLAGDPAYADIEAALNQQLDAFFARYTKPEADLWQGGVPLQNTERRTFWQDAWGEAWAPVYHYG